MKAYPAILGSLFNTPLLIHPEKLKEIALLMQRRADGVEVEYEGEQQPQLALYDCECAEVTGVLQDDGKIAVAEGIQPAGNAFVASIPLFGTMFQHGGMSMRASGGTSTEAFGRQFSALVNNNAIKSIIIETHSPGGQVWGTQELADMIYSARQQGKRVITAVNSMAASAALWVGTAASKVYVTPGGEMGSLGVVVMHEDYSEADAKIGVKTTFIATPEAKVEGNPYEPLSDEAAARIKEDVDATYTVFLDAVARNRGVTKQTAQENFGGGRMLMAKQAVKAGLADGVKTMREVLSDEVARLKSFQNRGNSKRNQRAIDIAEAELS